MWGEFSQEGLEALRGLLDRHDYLATASLPLFRTRRVYPLRDLAHAYGRWRGCPASLAAVSYPRLASAPVSAGALALREVFLGHRPLPAGLLSASEEVLLTRAGLLGPEGAMVQVAAAAGLYLMSSIPRRSPGEFVYLGDDTGMLLDRTADVSGRRALDMGTGCGAVALSLARRFSQVVGSDVNPTALALARSNGRLSRIAVDFVASDVWQGIEGNFDFVAANLPALPISLTPNLAFAAAGEEDPTALTRRFFERLEEFLEPMGVCRMLTFSPVDGQGDRLLREASERLGTMSMEYFVRDEMALASPVFRRLRHVVIRVVKDDRRGRVVRFAPWWQRLSLPFVPPGAPVQGLTVARC